MKYLTAFIFFLSILPCRNIAFADTSATLFSLENARQSAQGGKAKASIVCTRGGYALVGWHDENVGGQSLYKQRGNKWLFVTGGGGAMHSQVLISNHVPTPIAVSLDKAFAAALSPGVKHC